MDRVGCLYRYSNGLSLSRARGRATTSLFFFFFFGGVGFFFFELSVVGKPRFLGIPPRARLLLQLVNLFPPIGK